MTVDLGNMTEPHRRLLDDVLARRNPTLVDRLGSTVSPAKADEIVSTLLSEFTDNLDEDWEPTDYGRTVHDVLILINLARIEQGPG